MEFHMALDRNASWRPDALKSYAIDDIEYLSRRGAREITEMVTYCYIANYKHH